MAESKDTKEILVVAPGQYKDFAAQLAGNISKQPGCKGVLCTPKQYESKAFPLGGSRLAILIGDGDENPATKASLAGIRNLRNDAGACFGFDKTTAVAFGEGKLEQREDFQKVLEKCAAILAGAEGFSSLGVSLAAGSIIFMPKNILMPGLVRLAAKVRKSEWEKRLKAEQTKAALTLFLAKHARAWAGLTKKN